MQAEQQAEQERQARVEAERNATAALTKLQETEKGLKVREEERGIVVTLSGSVLFASGAVDLLPAARDRLSDVADVLKETQSPLLIEGHTDSQGPDAFNEDLSYRRAERVREFLTSRGVPAERINIRGLGEYRPVATNSSAEGRANNRRVEIIIERDQRAVGGSGSQQQPGMGGAGSQQPPQGGTQVQPQPPAPQGGTQVQPQQGTGGAGSQQPGQGGTQVQPQQGTGSTGSQQRYPGGSGLPHATPPQRGTTGSPSEQATPPTTGGTGGSGQDVGSVGTGHSPPPGQPRDLSGVDVQGQGSGSGSLDDDVQEGVTPPQPGAQPGQSDTQPPR